jgi:hypothetical protein
VGGGTASLLAFSDLTFADPSGQLGKLSGGLSPSAAVTGPPPVQQPPPGSSSQDPQDDSLLYASSAAASSRLSGGVPPLSGKSSQQQLDYGAGTSAAGYGSPSAAALMGYSPLTGGASGTGDHMATGSGGGVVTKQEAFGLEATTVQQQQQQQAAAAAAASLAEFNQATSKGHEILSQVCNGIFVIF